MICPVCDRDVRPRQTYCSDRCRLRAYRARESERILASERSRQRHRRRKEDPQKMHARNAIGNRLRRGLIQRGPCEVCGDPKTEAHHDDYSKPLDVRWLCRTHHELVHHPIAA